MTPLSVVKKVLAHTLLLILSLSISGYSYAGSDCPDLRPSNTSATSPRLALLIGNAQYQASPAYTLNNSVNDALAMAQVLAKTGFEVTCLFDASRAELLLTLLKFQGRVNKAGADAVSLFYYAGHGVQIGGNNYLLPVEFPLNTTLLLQPEQLINQLDIQAVTLDQVMQTLVSAKNELGSRFLILDACRENPLGTGWGKPKAEYSIKGLFWAFGTGFGKLADDGSEGNGLFTAALIEAIPTQGATIEQVLKKVTAAVAHQSGGEQIPEVGGSLVNDFMFIPGERITVQTRYHTTPLWLQILYWSAALAAVVLAVLYYRHRKRTAWLQGINLKQELKISPAVSQQWREKTRLADADIKGYVKDIRAGTVIGLITSFENPTIGRKTSNGIVIDHNAISGVHAQVGWDEERNKFWFMDKGSTNGSWWGKERPIEADKRYYVNSGQLLYLADQNTPLVILAHRKNKTIQ
ncbi:MAG: caspase family protein [Gammaproteobacteria bacterium]|nr:caspase family protein [Gammaproteobacteria bacterium]